MLRAYVNYRVPEHFFNRTSVAVEDFTYLAKRYEEDPKILSRSSYWEILFHLGKAYQTLEEPEKAREIWQKLIAVKPSLRYLRLLQAEGFDVGPIDEDAEAAAARARLLQEGVALHDRGIAGDKAAAEQALQLFEAAVEEYPDDALIKAYYGSSISLASRLRGRRQRHVCRRDQGDEANRRSGEDRARLGGGAVCQGPARPAPA